MSKEARGGIKMDNTKIDKIAEIITLEAYTIGQIYKTSPKSYEAALEYTKAKVIPKIFKLLEEE